MTVSELRWRAGSGLRAIPVGILVERVALEISTPPSPQYHGCHYRSACVSYSPSVGTVGYGLDGPGIESLCV